MRTIQILKICKIINKICLILCIVLFICGIIIFNYTNWRFSYVASPSMAPSLEVGDIAVWTPLKADQAFDELQTGDIAIYDAQNYGNYIVHRIQSKNIDKDTQEQFFVFKGDRNAVVDPKIVKPEQIQGKYLFTIKGGYKFIPFLDSFGGVIYGFTMIGMFLVIDINLTNLIRNKQPQS